MDDMQVVASQGGLFCLFRQFWWDLRQLIIAGDLG